MEVLGNGAPRPDSRAETLRLSAPSAGNNLGVPVVEQSRGSSLGGVKISNPVHFLPLTSPVIATLTAICADSTGGISRTETKRSSESSSPARCDQVGSFRFRVARQRKYFNDAIPNELAFENLHYWHRFNVF